MGFVGSARSSSEIIVQWQPPLEEHRNGHILGYIIRYRLFGYNESPWTTRNITNEAQKNYLIPDLITWKDYVVQIAAYNNKGVGLFTEGTIVTIMCLLNLNNVLKSTFQTRASDSSGIKIKTREGVPEAPPAQVRGVAVNSTSIKVWWKPPNPQKINGINQGYKLQAWKDSTEFKSMTVPPSLFDPLAEQNAVMGGLEKYTEYNITVLCFTDPGDGKRSAPVLVKTKEDGENFFLRKISSSSFYFYLNYSSA